MARLDNPGSRRARTSLSRWVRPSLAPGQNSPACSRAAEETARPDGRVHHRLARRGPLQVADQILAVHPFPSQVAGGAGAQGLKQVLLVVIRAEQHHFPGGVTLDQPAAQVKAAQRAPQPHVGNDDIGIQRGHQTVRVLGVGRLRDHPHPPRIPA